MTEDIGNMSYGLRANAKDLFDRRHELGEQEIKDIVEAATHLTAILREFNFNQEIDRAA